MIRLAHPEITQILEFKEDCVQAIVIENRDFFRKIVLDLSNQILGVGGDFVLSKDYTPLDISKHMELITQFVPFSMNNKSLLSKICSAMEREAVNESNYASTQALIAEIERHFDKLLFPFPYGFEYEKLNIGNLIKSAGISFQDDYDNGLEKILDFMQLVREFDREKVYTFINLRSYYSDQAISVFANESVAKKFKILLIDNVENSRLQNEQRLIIDKDLCEIY